MLKKIIIGTAILGVTVLSAGWLFGWFSANPAIAEVQQLQTQLADPNMKDDQRRALMQEIRTKMESMSPDARRTVWEGNRQMFEKRTEQHIDQILAMSAAERNKA